MKTLAQSGHNNMQLGFTLIETILALLLGTLLVAAAGQLMVTGQLSFLLQRANADIQDNSNFGLNYIVADIRKANFGASAPVVDNRTNNGGIVLSSNNVSSLTNPITLTDAVLTSGNGDSGWTGLSNVNVQSDQLTIQYKTSQSEFTDEEFNLKTLTAEEGAVVVGTDCEGRNITLQDVKNETYIIQRYFLRKDTTASGEPNEPLALACAAGRYDNTSSSIATLSGSGEIIMRRVDHFHARFMVAEGSYDAPTNMRYMTIKQYKTLVNGLALTVKPPRILSVQLGLVTRSSDSVGTNSLVNNTPLLEVMEQDVRVKTASNNTNKYLRQVLVQTVALRNGLGEDNR